MRSTPRRTWLVVIPALCVAVTLVGTGIAGQATLPHQFTNGTTADATQVNENFAALRDEINDNDTRLAAVESASQATQYFSVMGAEFEPDTTSGTWFQTLQNTQICGYADAGAGHTALAQLSLPNGARIRRIRAVMYDASMTNNVTLYVMQRPIPAMSGVNPSNSIPFQMTTSGSGGYELLDSGVIDIPFNSASNVYHLTVGPIGSWEAGQTLGISMVVVDWTRN